MYLEMNNGKKKSWSVADNSLHLLQTTRITYVYGEAETSWQLASSLYITNMNCSSWYLHFSILSLSIPCYLFWIEKNVSPCSSFLSCFKEI